MPPTIQDSAAVRGRGARSNATGRFELHAREAFDDGWTAEDEPKQVQTTLARENARKIITRNDSPDIGFDQSINPYRGCEHGWVKSPFTQLVRVARRTPLIAKPAYSHSQKPLIQTGRACLSYNERLWSPALNEAVAIDPRPSEIDLIVFPFWAKSILRNLATILPDGEPIPTKLPFLSWQISDGVVAQGISSKAGVSWKLNNQASRLQTPLRLS